MMRPHAAPCGLPRSAPRLQGSTAGQMNCEGYLSAIKERVKCAVLSAAGVRSQEFQQQSTHQEIQESTSSGLRQVILTIVFAALFTCKCRNIIIRSYKVYISRSYRSLHIRSYGSQHQELRESTSAGVHHQESTSLFIIIMAETYADLCRKCHSTTATVSWCRAQLLLPEEHECVCGADCRLVRRPRYPEGECFRCPRKGCQKVTSFRTGTFFENSSLSLEKIIRIIYLWAVLTPLIKMKSEVDVSIYNT